MSKINVTPTGVTFEGDVPEDAVEQLVAKAGRAAKACMFIIGDAINYSDAKWGEKYDRWIELTDLEYQTLRHAASVARKVQLCLRRHNLTFAIHKVVAPLPPEEQEKWLRIADEESMTVCYLRRSLMLGRPATDEDFAPAPDAKGIENVHPYVNRICAFWRKLQDAGWTDEVDSQQLRFLARDLQPVVDVRDQVLALANQRRAEEEAGQAGRARRQR